MKRPWSVCLLLAFLVIVSGLVRHSTSVRATTLPDCSGTGDANVQYESVRAEPGAISLKWEVMFLNPIAERIVFICQNNSPLAAQKVAVIDGTVAKPKNGSFVAELNWKEGPGRYDVLTWYKLGNEWFHFCHREVPSHQQDYYVCGDQNQVTQIRIHFPRT